ncbi:MAG: D-alanyl-D-alanine carboxypeptidase, partial [Lachnospiraceae bacterium]|nr:D-alanyl-D-alanine carboxypeptidase [Lachnospiraceae bacterium]
MLLCLCRGNPLVSARAGEFFAHEGETDAEEVERITPRGLYAYASCLLDAENDRVLFENHGNEALPMASTTKIMTLIVLLEHASMDDVVTVSG